MNLSLAGRVAIVTGAGRGLGRAAALALAAEGANVLGVARSREQLDSLRAEGAALADVAPDPGAAAVADAIAVEECDLRDPAAVAALPARAVDAFGRLDIVVNNAGLAPGGAFADQDTDLWREVFEVNVFAPVTLTRAAAGPFADQGGGKVINIASTSGLKGKPMLAAYSASKGAMLRFTEALSGEWARANVQVNAIAPGAFETELQSAVLGDAEILRRRLRKIPAGRMGRSEEIGPLVCLLASPASDFVTGSVFVSDGGEVARL